MSLWPINKILWTPKPYVFFVHEIVNWYLNSPASLNFSPHCWTLTPESKRPEQMVEIQATALVPRPLPSRATQSRDGSRFAYMESTQNRGSWFILIHSSSLGMSYEFCPINLRLRSFFLQNIIEPLVRPDQFVWSRPVTNKVLKKQVYMWTWLLNATVFNVSPVLYNEHTIQGIK